MDVMDAESPPPAPPSAVVSDANPLSADDPDAENGEGRDNLLQALVAEVAALRQEITPPTGSGSGESERDDESGLLARSVRRIVARLTESPTNWHQATAFACTSEDAKVLANRWWLFAGSVVIVLFQCTAAIGALRNTMAVACANNDHCPHPGM
jgi:hypothetical protein